MSDISGVRTGSRNTPPPLEAQPTTSQSNRPASQSPTSPTRLLSHPLSEALSARGAAGVGTTTVGSSSGGGSAVRRAATLPLTNPPTALQRHTPPSPTVSSTRTPHDVRIERAAADFMDAIGESAPILSTDPTQNLQQHAQRVNATMQGVRQVFEAAARASGSDGDRIQILQHVPDTPEIQNARAHLTEKSRAAEQLATQAGTKRSNADALKRAAAEADEGADAAAERTSAARKHAATCESRFNAAESAASEADKAASGKENAATAAEAEAATAKKLAEAKGGEAQQAHKAASDAQAAATQKEAEADGLGKKAGDAEKNAAAKQSAALDAEREAKALRAEAQGLAGAEANATEKDKPAAQLAARQAEERASKAETAAQEAKVAAEEAAKEAQTLKADAQNRRAEADGLRAKANAAAEHALTADGIADSANKKADALSTTAKSIRSDARAAREQARKLARDVEPLGVALNAAKLKVSQAVTKQAEAQEKARTTNEDATRAEKEATAAEQALRTAREEEQEAGVALRDVIARTPVPETRPDVPEGSESAHDTVEHSGGDDPASAAAAAATGGTPAAQKSKLARWGRNVLNTGGQQLAAVALTTALREAVGAGVEALLRATGASPETKTAIAGSLYGAVILANVMEMLYQGLQGDASRMTYGGGAANIVALTAAVATAASTDTLKDLVPSLVKTFAYSGGRDAVNLLMPLSDNVPKDKANPLAVQALDSLFYAGNQMLVNSIQSFTGLSGAGFVDAMRDNSTDPNTKEAVTLQSGFASLASYVTANFAGEFVDQFSNRILNNAMSGGKLADLEISLGPVKWPGAGKALETFATEGVPRTSIFYSVYGVTAGLNPHIQPSHFGETGASWLQNFAGGAMIALLCLPAVMVLMKGKRRGSAVGGGDVEQGGGTPFTELTTPTTAASNAPTATIPLGNPSRAQRSNAPESGGDHA